MSKDSTMATRRTFLRMTLAAAALVVATPATPAQQAMAETQIYDAKKRKWVKYDKQKARDYYIRNDNQLPEAFRIQPVNFRTAEKPGTIIIDGNQHFLYLVQPGGKAIRYGIAVGRDAKARKWAAGMPGGPDNPLGARALYLYEGSEDTIYRIHGTPEPWTIGHNVSSGCVRMRNEDITDLHSRIKVGAKVIVLMQGAALYKGV